MQVGNKISISFNSISTTICIRAALDAKLILAQPGIGLLIGVTREIQAIKAAVGGAIGLVKDIAPTPMMIMGALVVSVMFK